MKVYRYHRFSAFASGVVRVIAHPNTFLGLVLITAAWVAAGSAFHYDNVWQAVTYCVCGILSFLVIFLLQHTQTREMTTIQLKLNELIRASEGTHNSLLDIEQLPDRDYEALRENYTQLAQQAREQLRDGKVKWATARIQMESFESLMGPSVGAPDAAATAATLDDPARTHALQALGERLSDPTGELPFTILCDRLTRAAALAVNVPVVLVTLVEADRQRFVSQTGLGEPYCSVGETPLSHSFCKHVVVQRKPLIIGDARKHPLVRENPAIAALGVVGYAGFPLMGEGGQVLGAFCAIDHEPRQWTADELAILRDLSEAVTQAIRQQPAAAGRTAGGGAGVGPPPAAERPAGAATIVVVDDSATNRKLLAHHLGADGYHVVALSDGTAALEYLGAQPADLILLDVMLPGLDGEGVLKALKMSDALRGIPVIMISALDEQESVQRCLALGASDYLLKPFDFHLLQDRLRTHLAER